MGARLRNIKIKLADSIEFYLKQISSKLIKILFYAYTMYLIIFNRLSHYTVIVNLLIKLICSYAFLLTVSSLYLTWFLQLTLHPDEKVNFSTYLFSGTPLNLVRDIDLCFFKDMMCPLMSGLHGGIVQSNIWLGGNNCRSRYWNLNVFAIVLKI